MKSLKCPSSAWTILSDEINETFLLMINISHERLILNDIAKKYQIHVCVEL